MGHFHYGRQFGLLAVAALILLLLSRAAHFSEPFLPTFAINGALHASALVLSLRAHEVLWRKAAFIALAAAFSVFALYVGILALELFAVLPSNERLYLALGLCAASGAITYGGLIRLFWMPKIPSRAILAIAFASVLAVLIGFFARSHFSFLGDWWLAAVWWSSFSGGLWYLDTQRSVITRSK
jgi:hypothetical protein